MIRSVAELTRELGHPPDVEILAARLGQSTEVTHGQLQALIAEKTLAEISPGRYGIRPQEPPVESSLPPQPELFEPPAAASVEEAPSEYSQAAISEGEGDVQPSADENPGSAPIESGSPPAEPDRKPIEPQPRRQAIDLPRRTRSKAGSATAVPRLLIGAVGNWQLVVIRAVMAASGIGASIVAGYFSISRLAQFMPRGLAALLGAFIVAFSVIAFETTLVFIQRKSYFVSAVFIALWGITVAFTLTATLAGFYNYFSALRVEHARSGAQEEVGRSELEGIREDEASLRERIVAKQSELGSLQKIVEDASQSVERRAEYGRVFYDAENRIVAGGREIDRLQAALDVDRQKERGILAAAPAVAVEAARPSQEFFDWVGGMMGIKASTLELITSLFPSLFIDLISSIGLAVALFLV